VIFIADYKIISLIVQGKGRPWAIPTRDKYHVCVASSKHIEEFSQASIHDVSLQGAVHEVGATQLCDYCFWGLFEIAFPATWALWRHTGWWFARKPRSVSSHLQIQSSVSSSYASASATEENQRSLSWRSPRQEDRWR